MRCCSGSVCSYGGCILRQMSLFGGGSERVLNRTEARVYLEFMLAMLRRSRDEKV